MFPIRTYDLTISSSINKQKLRKGQGLGELEVRFTRVLEQPTLQLISIYLPVGRH